MVFLTFHIFPYFSHIPFICLQRTLDGKHSVFIDFWIFEFFFSCLWASWVVLAAVFWEVQGISNTPRLISPLEKSLEIVFNLALSCSGFPNLSYFPLFRNISSIFLSFASKERWYAFGSYIFLSLFPASGQVGWSWQLPTLISEECRASPMPLK